MWQTESPPRPLQDAEKYSLRLPQKNPYVPDTVCLRFDTSCPLLISPKTPRPFRKNLFLCETSIAQILQKINNKIYIGFKN